MSDAGGGRAEPNHGSWLGKSAPIGVFDSGVGGLTVARAIMDQLPAESIRYLGDTAHGPYGPQPIAEVRAHALAAMDQLVDSGVKMLVVACNSASAACLHDARERYDVPVVEVILPAVRRAIAATRTGKIGVIGTQTTIRSRAYDDAFAAAPQVTVLSAACPSFVDFVERGITSGRQVLGLAQSYLEPLLGAEVDTLVLGCTHYPLLTGAIGHVMGDGVTLVSSAEETAKDVFRVLTDADLLRDGGDLDQDVSPGEHRFFSTGDAETFHRLAERFLGPAVGPIATLPATQTAPKTQAERVPDPADTATDTAAAQRPDAAAAQEPGTAAQEPDTAPDMSPDTGSDTAPDTAPDGTAVPVPVTRSGPVPYAADDIPVPNSDRRQ